MKAPLMDKQELKEWMDALEDVETIYGKTGVQELYEHLGKKIGLNASVFSNLNNISSVDAMPEGNEVGIEAEKINLWNAQAMVVQAEKKSSGLGGHLASYASASVGYRVGFDYFFKGAASEHGGDLVYFQGHIAPGIYARSYLEGRLSEKELSRFRQEVDGGGLSSYPHPWSMPEYWQFATVSMGLAMAQGIAMAKWLKYMHNRSLLATQDRCVWVFCGDGEMDEPESRGLLSDASLHGLGRLIVVVNCNLQRLDGPVRGNGQIITELERVFKGADWEVLKVVWSQGWCDLFERDLSGQIEQVMGAMIDGMYQSLMNKGVDALLEHLQLHCPDARDILRSLTDEEKKVLLPGGLDDRMVYGAYQEAIEGNKKKPKVILLHTQKGYGFGQSMAGANQSHQKKKLTAEELLDYGRFCLIPMEEEDIKSAKFFHPGKDSVWANWVKERRDRLGGFLPERRVLKPMGITLPEASVDHVRSGFIGKELSSTMAYVRILQMWLKDKKLGPRIVPIVADEARTFGMEGLFRMIGIYSPEAMRYQSVDDTQIAPYVEKTSGQLIQEGINETGAISTWLAAATAYSHSGFNAVPCYIFYSMFGFQRIGDLLWAAGDMRARGFLLGATAGRTTLMGEGLQHCDGQSLMMASFIPNCVSYDVCFADELLVVMEHGLKRMLEDQEDVFFYLTLYNERIEQKSKQEKTDKEGIINGMSIYEGFGKVDLHLLASGPLVIEAKKARDALEKQGIHIRLWSVSSFTELARGGKLAKDRTDGKSGGSYLEKCLADGKPVLAVSDHVVSYVDQIRPYIKNQFDHLGTDGFGLSDGREKLRKHFKVDHESIVKKVLSMVVQAWV